MNTFGILCGICADVVLVYAVNKWVLKPYLCGLVRKAVADELSSAKHATLHLL